MKTQEEKINQMFRIIARAQELEWDDKHLIDSSRKRIVKYSLETFKDLSYLLLDFPFGDGFTNQFVWIIKDL